MCQGRGSAVVSWMAIMVVAMTLAGHFVAAEAAATYVVGGRRGWTFNVANWPQGKRFRAGDILKFNYQVGAHNVVRVDSGGYRGCKPTHPMRARTYRTGRDQIKLIKGLNFFICTFPGQCQSGMKIVVNAF